MARVQSSQASHDGAVYAAAEIYRQHARYVWINPNGEKNKDWCGYYIDVIAAEDAQPTSAWVIEIETEDSVTDSEASGQWRDYDKAYTRWHLAVPVASAAEARRLIGVHGIQHCSVLTWQRDSNGTHTFWGLPGLA